MEVFVKGVSVLIDEEDYLLFNKYSWYIDNIGYVRTNHKRLHRLLLGLTDVNLIVDHINKNKLDNRRCNLRICTKKENNQNTSVRKNSTSKYLGVYLSNYISKSDIRKWVADCDGKHLGNFYTEDEAAIAYNKQASLKYGEFACLNKIK